MNRKFTNTKVSHENLTVKLASVTISFTSNYTLHEVNIAHIMEGDYFYFSQRDQICPVRTMKENSSNTEMTNVKYTSLPDRNTHVLRNHFPQLNR